MRSLPRLPKVSIVLRPQAVESESLASDEMMSIGGMQHPDDATSVLSAGLALRSCPEAQNEENATGKFF